ncbi:MAG: sulfoacetaldehyde acetyltransferase [Acidimicrobiales bacterium]
MTRMTSSEAFVETLVAHGIDNSFGIVGSAYMDALDLFPAAGIRFLSVAHEQNAAHMADGFSRVTGRHGMCIAQNGPGVTNFVTAIAAAFWAHSPVVAITPETGTMGQGQGGFQETEQLPIFEKITKYQVQVNRIERIAELTHRALTLAMVERGPVQVNIPRDLFYGEADYTIREPQYAALGAGAADELAKATQLLAEARNPVIMAGGGVLMSTGTGELVALAEHLQAPVITAYLHNDAFPASHPLYCGPIGYQGWKLAMNVVADADVVLCLGTRLGPFGTLPQHGLEYWPANAKLIQIDSDHRTLGLTRDVAVAVNGDARAAAVDLLERLRATTVQSSATAAARLSDVGRLRAAWEAELDSWSSAGGTPVAPRRALRELEQAMPADAMVATDIGNICSVANSYLRFDRPNSMLAPMMWGNCGYSFPTAMGAKVAAPERPAIAYVGDGAWGMSLTEMMTCVRENIGVVAVVFNNSQWGAEKRNQIDYYDSRFVGSDLHNPSFAAIARAMGGEGITVSSPGEIGDALRTAVTSGRPTVLEVMCTEELSDPFRRDALQHPVRLLDKYRHLNA